MEASNDVQRVIGQLQAALAQSTGRISDLSLRVSELGVDLATVFEKGVSGEVDLKLVKLGGGGGQKDTSTISLTFEPSDTVSASQIDDELTNALVVIEAAIAALDAEFVLTKASVEVAFETTVGGKIALVIGGEASRSQCHIARIVFEPTG